MFLQIDFFLTLNGLKLLQTSIFFIKYLYRNDALLSALNPLISIYYNSRSLIYKTIRIINNLLLLLIVDVFPHYILPFHSILHHILDESLQESPYCFKRLFNFSQYNSIFFVMVESQKTEDPRIT
jgi:hypothetical protein